MKKFFAWTLVLILVLSAFGFTAKNTAADANEVTISDLIDIASSGVPSGDNAGHGNHQTRIVRTSHGEYACYPTDRGNGTNVNEMSVYKIDAEAGTSEVIFQEVKPYDSSQACLIVDNDENVWMVVVSNDSAKEQFDGRDSGVWLAAYRIDAATDDVDGYTSLLPLPAKGTGYSYSSFYYDPSMNCIYTIGFDGDDSLGDIYWFTFDCSAKEWTGYGQITTDIRHGYPFMIADGKGGAYVICQDDYGCSAAGYPEIGNNNGLTEADLATFHRWSANYCWDELDFFYIPDMTVDSWTETTIVPKDYSRVIGDQAYRYSLEGRSTNEYPGFQMNNGGDMIIDQEGNMHVLYKKTYMLAAYDRSNTESSIYHDVYDLTDPANPVLLSSTLLMEEVSEGVVGSYWRLYEATDGTLYYMNTVEEIDDEAVFYVRKLTGTPATGYTNEVVAEKTFGECDSNITVANMRSNSLIDDTVDVIIMHDGDWDFFQVELPSTMPPTGDNSLVIWGIAAVAALAGVCVLLNSKKRKLA